MYYNPYGWYWPQQETSDVRDAKDVCIKLMNFYVIGILDDGTQVEGIIEDADDEEITMLVPENVEETEIDTNRQFGTYGGYGFGNGYPRRRFRRFRRRRFPVVRFVFPFFFPFPFYY